jgi:hypothetical protein
MFLSPPVLVLEITFKDRVFLVILKLYLLSVISTDLRYLIDSLVATALDKGKCRCSEASRDGTPPYFTEDLKETTTHVTQHP